MPPSSCRCRWRSVGDAVSEDKQRMYLTRRHCCSATSSTSASLPTLSGEQASQCGLLLGPAGGWSGLERGDQHLPASSTLVWLAMKQKAGVFRPRSRPAPASPGPYRRRPRPCGGLRANRGLLPKPLTARAGHIGTNGTATHRGEGSPSPRTRGLMLHGPSGNELLPAPAAARRRHLLDPPAPMSRRA